MKQNYYYGSPNGDEELVLDILSKSDLKSFKTSSIPLTEFWLLRNENVSKKLLDKIDTDIDFESAFKCFEYPVYATEKDSLKKIGRPSMTDLMIITAKYAIAVEGKFTEDLYDTIKEWIDGCSEKSEKPVVLKSWYDYIESYCDYKLSDPKELEEKVVYQFLHRTASACKTSIDKNKLPVVLYQLFYDKEDPKSLKHQEDVKKKLEEFASLLHFKYEKIKLVIELTPITNFDEVKEKYSWAKADLFNLMKKNKVYKFE